MPAIKNPKKFSRYFFFRSYLDTFFCTNLKKNFTAAKDEKKERKKYTSKVSMDKFVCTARLGTCILCTFFFFRMYASLSEPRLAFYLKIEQNNKNARKWKKKKNGKKWSRDSGRGWGGVRLSHSARQFFQFFLTQLQHTTRFVLAS